MVESTDSMIENLRPLGYLPPLTNQCSYIYKYKNIFNKMLKDVGMAVPKTRETIGWYICHKAKHTQHG